MSSILNDEQRIAFEEDGYVLVRGFYDDTETGLMRTAMEEDPAISKGMYNREDTEGGKTRLALWDQPGDNVYGMAARCEKIVDAVEDLLGGEIYHYHSKLSAKNAFEGGAWEWHQDYGYWYHNGFLSPAMASVMIALDHTTLENGCLKVLQGSHKLGRIDHSVIEGQQVGADLTRVSEAEKHLETVPVLMDPGDALFFHSNLLHRSDQNNSPDRRWTLICCYNRSNNRSFDETEDAKFCKLDKVPNQAIREAGSLFASSEEAKQFRKSGQRHSLVNEQMN